MLLIHFFCILHCAYTLTPSYQLNNSPSSNGERSHARNSQLQEQRDGQTTDPSRHQRTSLRKDIGARVSELIGTWIYVAIATGVSALNPDIFTSAIACALGIFTAMYLTGARCNPTVTLAAFLVDKITMLSFVRTVCDIIAQLIGGIIASGLVRLTQGQVAGLVKPVSPHSPGEAFITEAMCLAFFGVVANYSAKQVRLKESNLLISHAIVSLTLFAVELYSFGISGGAVNFARALGPSVIAGQFGPAFWVYWASSLLGGVVAMVVLYLWDFFIKVIAGQVPEETSIV